MLTASRGANVQKSVEKGTEIGSNSQTICKKTLNRWKTSLRTIDEIYTIGLRFFFLPGAQKSVRGQTVLRISGVAIHI